MGACVECGVAFGNFAYHINNEFSHKTLYLFDAFSGFDKNDLANDPLRVLMHNALLKDSKEILCNVDPRLDSLKMPIGDGCSRALLF